MPTHAIRLETPRRAVHSAALLVAILTAAPTLHAAPLTVSGSPGYTPGVGGFQGGHVPPSDSPETGGDGVNGSGVAIGYSNKSSASGQSLGERAVRWSADGSSGELGTLTMNGGSVGYARGKSINASGVAVGHSQKYAAGGANLGMRAVRWNAGSSTAVELGTLGTNSSGSTQARALDINDAGVAIGYGTKFTTNGAVVGERPIRWDAAGTIATELGLVGSGSGSEVYGQAFAISSAGLAVGFISKVIADGTDVGFRAVRWDSSGTSATELGSIRAIALDYTYDESFAYDINSSGTVVGAAEKYGAGDASLGFRAVRWNAGGTAATELGALAADTSGVTSAAAVAVNAAGASVGFSVKFDGNSYLGRRAVRWNANAVIATELGNLGTDAAGIASAQARALNGAGTAVGFSTKYNSSGASLGSRAVVWGPDAAAIDLNDLGVVTNPAGGSWTLTSASDIADNGWAAGSGTFDPDGPGGQSAYTRLWVGQIGLGGSWLTTTGGQVGTWGAGANWSTGTPAIQRDAVFSAAAGYGVNFDRNESAPQILVTAGSPALFLGEKTLTVENGVIVTPGAELRVSTRGFGRIIGDLTVNGTLDVGDGMDRLTTVQGGVHATGTVEFDIAGKTTNSFGGYDRLSLFQAADSSGGSLTLDGATIAITLSGYSPMSSFNSWTPEEGDGFGLVMSNGGITGTWTFDFTNAQLPPGLAWDTSNFAAYGNLEIVSAAVPEPATLATLGLAAMLLVRRRR